MFTVGYALNEANSSLSISDNGREGGRGERKREQGREGGINFAPRSTTCKPLKMGHLRRITWQKHA